MLARIRPLSVSASIIRAHVHPKRSVFSISSLPSRRTSQALISYRSFSTSENSKSTDSTKTTPTGEENSSREIRKIDYDEYDDYEPRTAKEKVHYYSVIGLRLGLLAFGCVCIYFTARELFPGRMNPNSLFSDVFEYLRYKEEVMQMIGEDMKAFGRDVGRSTEGRRNHVDSFKYKAEDGSNRLRIRFNIKGAKGQLLVWAEVSDSMADNEYVYIIAQNLRNGQVQTFVDNRDQLEAGLVSNGDDSFLKGLTNIFNRKD